MMKYVYSKWGVQFFFCLIAAWFRTRVITLQNMFCETSDAQKISWVCG